MRLGYERAEPSGLAVLAQRHVVSNSERVDTFHTLKLTTSTLASTCQAIPTHAPRVKHDSIRPWEQNLVRNYSKYPCGRVVFNIILINSIARASPFNENIAQRYNIF